jgi:hypothetical protein
VGAGAGTDNGTTEEEGGGTEASSAWGAAAPSRGEGASTGNRELDGGVFWQEELAFIAGFDRLKSRGYRESISRRFLGQLGGAFAGSEDSRGISATALRGRPKALR